MAKCSQVWSTKWWQWWCKVGIPCLTSGLTALTLAACGESASTPTDGTVTGLASPCIGAPAPPSNPNDFEYTISIYEGSRTVARQKLQGGDLLRGTDSMSRPGIIGFNYPGTVDVTVRAGLYHSRRPLRVLRLEDAVTSRRTGSLRVYRARSPSRPRSEFHMTGDISGTSGLPVLITLVIVAAIFVSILVWSTRSRRQDRS